MNLGNSTFYLQQGNYIMSSAGEITVEGHKLAGDDIQLARKLKDAF